MMINNSNNLLLQSQEEVELILNTGLFNNSDIKYLPNNTPYINISGLTLDEQQFILNIIYNDGLY